jgi:hypothetical protein
VGAGDARAGSAVVRAPARLKGAQRFQVVGT